MMNWIATVCMNLAHMQSILSDNIKEQAATFARIGKRHIINLCSDGL